jgi:hypothetical protein
MKYFFVIASCSSRGNEKREGRLIVPNNRRCQDFPSIIVASLHRHRHLRNKKNNDKADDTESLPNIKLELFGK